MNNSSEWYSNRRKRIVGIYNDCMIMIKHWIMEILEFEVM